MNKQFLIIVLLFLGLIAYLTRNRWLPLVQHNPEIVNGPIFFEQEKIGKTYDIKRISVLRGDTFDITLKDESRIIGRLETVKTVDEAKGKMIDLLNHCTNPKVVLLRRLEQGAWHIELLATHNGAEISITNWLEKNKLVFQQ